MTGDQINVQQSSEPHPLHEYRLTKVEDAVAILSEGFASIASTIRGAKVALAIIFGVVQPVMIGVLIYVMTNNGGN